MTDHPITPPPELVQQWYDQAKQDPCGPINWVATRAAQWGADQELEACCEWLIGWDTCEGERLASLLHKGRRPGPPSLKEQALHELAGVYNRDEIDDAAYDIIRRALEQLDD